MKNNIFLIFILSFNITLSQTNLDINKAIEMAITNSNLYKKINSEFNYSKVNNNLIKKTFLPSVFISSVFPSISKSVVRVTTPNGQDIFVNQNQAYYDLSLNIEQKEPLLGGNFILSSFLNRIDLFGNFNNKTYYSSPFSLSYTNENFFFNSYKYEKAINNLRIEENDMIYNLQVEDIVYQTVENYFTNYVVNRNIEDNQYALKNQKELFNIAKERFKIGSLNKGDLLSLELNILDIETSLDDLILEQKNSEKALLNLIKYNSDWINLVLPEENESILNLNISYELALDKMTTNNKLMTELKRKQKEKELEIEKQKYEDKLSIGFNASYGLFNTGNSFVESTTNLSDQQSYSISLRYLLFDFGKNKQKIELLNMEKEFLDNDFQIEIENLKRELFSLVNRFANNQKRLATLVKKNIISKNRYDFLKNRFSLGNVTITDLNIAQRESRQIDSEYLQTLKEIWITYHNIRKLTMFDFNKNLEIKYN